MVLTDNIGVIGKCAKSRGLRKMNRKWVHWVPLRAWGKGREAWSQTERGHMMQAIGIPSSFTKVAGPPGSWGQISIHLRVRGLGSMGSISVWGGGGYSVT